MKKDLLFMILALCGIAAQAQWTSDPATNNRITPDGQLDYGTRDVCTDGNGRTYIVSVAADVPTQQSYRLQIVDENGALTLPDNGLEISSERTLSYTTVNQKLLVDRDGNAIVITHDCRNAASGATAIGYTAYKVSPDGTMLWGNTGVDLDGGSVHYGSAVMNAVQTSDGGYVFAYTVWDENNKEEVHVEKLSADGEAAWDTPLLLTDTDRSYSTPYVVDTGDNQVMLFYLSGTNQDIMARLVDFDGSSVWNEDTTVYRGGFDSTPAYTFIDVWQAPEGAFITWRDDRYYEGSYSNYISYVKTDGSLGFPGDSDALKISYADELSRMNPQIVYDEGQGCIYAVYRQFYQSAQSYNGISMQKISLDGELQWGSEGKAVVDVTNEKYAAYATVQLAGGTDIAVFWQTQGDGEVVMSYAMKYDSDGNPLWDEPLSFTTTASDKNNLQSSPLIDESYWLLRWNDYRDYGSGSYSGLYMQRINTDGTLGTPGSTGIGDVSAAVAAGSSVTVYDITGKRLATLPSADNPEGADLLPGLYIIRDNASGIAHKILVK